jgi:DNA-binding transcriptional LysR family regulator
VASLVQRYPSLVVEILADDERRDLVAERFDIAIRAGKMDDSSYAQRRLLSEPEIVVGTPELVDRFAHAVRPRELLGAPWVTHTSQHDGTWTFHDEDTGETDELPIRSRMRVNSVAMMLVLILRGSGLGTLPVSVFADDLAARRLVRICPRWVRRHLAMYAVLPSGKNPPARVTIFLDALRASLAERLPGAVAR